MKNDSLYVSELSTSRHIFNKYHFCRGNSNRRKSRFGIIIKGNGTYIYLNKKLRVKEGDVVFIPENIYCYSEWHGEPEIEVVYLSCFMHYESFKYEPQIIESSLELQSSIIQISDLLSSSNELDILEAYSRFYKLLQSVIVKMRQTDIAFDKTLQTAIEFITDNWDKSLSISEVSRSVGFNSENHFRKLFYEYTGILPYACARPSQIMLYFIFLRNSYRFLRKYMLY